MFVDDPDIDYQALCYYAAPKRDLYDKLVWINPTPQETWEYSSSVGMTRQLVDDQMYPLTIRGLEESMNFLSK